MLIAVAVSGCARQELVIYNGCGRSWVRVRDGEGRLLVSRLDYGHETVVDLKGYQGSTVHLLAAGFEMGTDNVLGSDSTSRTIPRFGGSPVGPSQINPWEIRYLYANVKEVGCQRR